MKTSVATLLNRIVNAGDDRVETAAALLALNLALGNAANVYRPQRWFA